MRSNVFPQTSPFWFLVAGHVADRAGSLECASMAKGEVEAMDFICPPRLPVSGNSEASDCRFYSGVTARPRTSGNGVKRFKPAPAPSPVFFYEKRPFEARWPWDPFFLPPAVLTCHVRFEAIVNLVRCAGVTGRAPGRATERDAGWGAGPRKAAEQGLKFLNSSTPTMSARSPLARPPRSRTVSARQPTAV